MLAESLGTIIASLVLLLGVGAIIWNLRRNRRKGTCGCGCGSCAMNGLCHKEEE